MFGTRNMLALGAVLGLAAVAAAGPAGVGEGKENGGKVVKGVAGVRASRTRAAQAANHVGHGLFVEGTVIHTQHGGTPPSSGSVMVRLGDGHRHLTGRSARRGLHAHHQQRAVRVLVTPQTLFEHVGSGSGKLASFNDVHRGDHVRVLLHPTARELARIVDILAHSRGHRRSSRPVAGGSGGSGSGGTPVATTTVTRRHHKVPLRHTLMRLRHEVRALSRRVDRLSAQIARRAAPGTHRVRPRLHRPLVRHSLMDLRKAGRLALHHVGPRIEHILRTGHTSHGGKLTAQATHTHKTNAVVKTGTNTVKHTASRPPSPPQHKATQTHHSSSHHSSPPRRR
jgi:hypothetical protein